jgi:DNA polymerase-3 subunit delta'
MTDIVAPRDAATILDCEGAERAFLEALARGRLHHAWLLVGPEGVGKATFAYRAARRLLGAAPSPRFGLLGADPDDPVFRQAAGRAHPDLLLLERDNPDEKARKWIPVEEARGLPEFFSKSPGRAAYRVAIIDAADDLGANAANAVLKTLEEPPERGVIFLVAHRPGALLPTLRSRCRRLLFPTPPAEASTPWLVERASVSEDVAHAYLRMARGAPGKALRFALAGALEVDVAVRALLARLPAIDPGAALTLADGFRGPEGVQKFALVMDRLAAALGERACAAARDGEAGAERWAEAASLAADLPGEVEAVNLERGDALFTALGRIAALARC